MELENETTAEMPTGVAVEIESDATLGYASIQNAVPVIRSLRLTNHGTEALQDVEVLIACNPSFAQGIKLRFDKLAVGESRLISPIDLQPDHAYLADLQESISASVHISVLVGSTEIASKSQSLQVLASTSGPVLGRSRNCLPLSACPITRQLTSLLARLRSFYAQCTASYR
jgi:hypothetical protein